MAFNTNEYGYLVDPMFSFTDASGKPLVGGYLMVFLANSTTKVLTHKDWDDKSSYNPERIPLDITGRTFGYVIVQKGVAYKILICDIDHDENDPVKTIDYKFAGGANVTVEGPVVQGLNSAESTSDLVDVTVADNKLKIEDKINPSDFASKVYVDNAVNVEKARAEGVEEMLRSVHEALRDDFNETKQTLEAKDAELDGKIAAVGPMVDNAVNVEKTRAEGEESRIEGKIDSKFEALEETVIPRIENSIDEINSTLDPLPEEIASLSQRITDEENERRSDVEGLQNAVNSKADNVTTQQAISELRAAVNSKADDYETAKALDSKAEKTTVIQLTTEVANKANKSYVDSQLGYKANASDMNTALNGKADKSTTYTKTEVDNKVSPKADKTYVDGLVGNVEALLAAL